MSESTALQRFLSVPGWLKRSNGNGMKGMVQPGFGAQGLNWLFSSGRDGLLPQTQVDYAALVGDGLGSSVLAGPLNFLMRTFLEAPPTVERRKKAREWEQEDDHPLTDLLDNPNPFYSGEALWMALVLDFAFGNAFIYKVRNEFDQVIQLWWIPRQLIWPRWKLDGMSFIDYYEYRPGTRLVEIPIRDIVHLRFGMDPKNPRLGLSQLGALMREVAIDDGAANFIASVHRNMGIVGVIISPKEKGTQVTKEALKETKEYLQKHFTGDNRGKALALGAPTDVQLLQYNLQAFDVSPVRDVSEERVCAALGLPAAVIGFGTGLQQTKVGATMKEMRQLAWTGGIIPIQRIIAKEIMRSLLPDFEAGKRQKARFTFDVSKVRALWEDNNEKHTRVREDFKAKLIDRSTALREVGRSVKPEDEGFYYVAETARLTETTPLPGDSNNPTDPNAPKRGDIPKVKYSADQARDDQGEWTDGGGGSGQSQVTDSGKQALLGYSESSTSLNGSLRRGAALTSGDTATQSALDAAFKNNKLSKDTILYRGVEEKFAAKLKVGETFTDKGFVSTSRDSGMTSLGRQVQISAKAGTPAVDVVHHLGSHPSFDKYRASEKEVLLNRGSKFKVVKITADHISLEQVP